MVTKVRRRNNEVICKQVIMENIISDSFYVMYAGPAHLYREN